MRAMLKDAPYKEEDRYTRLRGYFTEFGCTGDHLTAITFEKDGRHKNLVCTLPGASPRKIVVTSWYPPANAAYVNTDGWPEAVVLPMLYHALQAQPRHFTFVFAELSGPHSLLNLLNQFRAADPSLPVALVSIKLLGLGAPQFTAIPPNAVPAPVRPNANVVQTEAWRIALLMHTDSVKPGTPGTLAGLRLFVTAYTPEGAKGIPSIMIYSSPPLAGNNTSVTLSDFRVSHDFLGFYLSDLDMKLDGSL